MDLFNLFTGIAPCIKMIFEYGMEPKENEIFELTEKQYEELMKDPSIDTSLKWYTWLPVQHSYESNELLVLNEKDRSNLLSAAKTIESYIEKSGKEFKNYDEKLTYVAKILPQVFSEGTKYGKATGLQLL